MLPLSPKQSAKAVIKNVIFIQGRHGRESIHILGWHLSDNHYKMYSNHLPLYFFSIALINNRLLLWGCNLKMILT